MGKATATIQEKRMTFNSCKVNFQVLPNQAIVTKTFEGSNEYSGIYVDIMKLIAELGNFGVAYEYMVQDQQNNDETGQGYDSLFSETTFTFFYDYVMNIFKPLRFVNLVEKEFYFVIPDGELYTEWEKLFLAFDEVTWLLIVITFAASFAVIIVIGNFATKVVQDFVFGEDVTTPSLNVLIALFGLGQIILPRRNFARFLLTMFIIWSLIIRTCYQGLLFEYMIGEGRKPAIKSIDELLERNFTYHIHMIHCYHLIDTNVAGKSK